MYCVYCTQNRLLLPLIMSRDLASGEARVTGDSSGLAIEVTGEAGYRCSVGPESSHVLCVLYTKPVMQVVTLHVRLTVCYKVLSLSKTSPLSFSWLS